MPTQRHLKDLTETEITLYAWQPGGIVRSVIITPSGDDDCIELTLEGLDELIAALQEARKEFRR